MERPVPVGTLALMAAKASQRDRKDFVIQVRVTPEQRQAMTDAAEREGLSLSTWIRYVALKVAAGELVPALKPPVKR